MLAICTGSAPEKCFPFYIYPEKSEENTAAYKDCKWKTVKGLPLYPHYLKNKKHCFCPSSFASSSFPLSLRPQCFKGTEWFLQGSKCQSIRVKLLASEKGGLPKGKSQVVLSSPMSMLNMDVSWRSVCWHKQQMENSFIGVGGKAMVKLGKSCSRQPCLYHNGPGCNGKHIVWERICLPSECPAGCWEYKQQSWEPCLLSSSTRCHLCSQSSHTAHLPCWVPGLVFNSLLSLVVTKLSVLKEMNISHQQLITIFPVTFPG